MKKDIVFQNGQKYFTITSSLRKHQNTTMLFFFKPAVFLLLSSRSAGTNLLPEAYSLPKGSPPF
jgi:hypothetical protein